MSFEFVALVQERSERRLLPVLADRLRAQMFLLLPVPFEQFYRDLPETRDEAGEVEDRWQAVQEYVALVARAGRHLELPLRFGPFQELDEADDVRGRREYQLAEACMLQHADAVLELWPGADADPIVETKTGGSDPIFDGWREPESIPAAFRWMHRMHEPPPREKETRALRELPGPWRGRLLTSVLRRESDHAPKEATPAGDA